MARARKPPHLLATTRHPEPILPDVMQRVWSDWKRSGYHWPLRSTAQWPDIPERVVSWWGPITVHCPASNKKLSSFVAYRTDRPDYGVVEDDASGSSDPRARWDAGKGPDTNPRLRLELHGWWAQPHNFSWCPTCRTMVYQLDHGERLDPTHHSGAEPHPGFTTTPPPVEANAMLTCTRCARLHVVNHEHLAMALYERSGGSYQLDPRLTTSRSQ